MSAEALVRGYELNIEAWSRGIEHKHPTIALYSKKDDLRLVIADDYGSLLAILKRLTELVTERAVQDGYRLSPVDSEVTVKAAQNGPERTSADISDATPNAHYPTSEENP